MKKILEVFLEELEARERVNSIKSKRSQSSQQTHPRRNRDYPTTRTFVGGVESGCCFCKQDNHSPVNCKRVTSVDERKRIIRENGLCFVCLRSGHISRNCRSFSNCDNCSGNHHVSVCWKGGKNRRFVTGGTRPQSEVANPKLSSKPNESSVTRFTGLNPESPAFEMPTPTTTCYAGNREATLL